MHSVVKPVQVWLPVTNINKGGFLMKEWMNGNRYIRCVMRYGNGLIKFISISAIGLTLGFMLSVLVSINVLADDVTEIKNDSYVELYNNLDDDIIEYINELSYEYDIPKEYIYGIAYNESRFQSNAINLNDNGTYDYGIMQINDSCYSFLHDEMGLNSMKELFDTHTCLKAGVILFDYHKQVVGSNNLALLRYQIGEGSYNLIMDEEISFPKSYYKTQGVIIKYKNYFKNLLTDDDFSATINS